MLYYRKIIKNVRIIFKAYTDSTWPVQEPTHYIWHLLPSINFYRGMSQMFLYKEQPYICIDVAFLVFRATVSFCKISDPFELKFAKGQFNLIHYEKRMERK